MDKDNQPTNKAPLTQAELEYRFSAMGLRNYESAWIGDIGILMVFSAEWAKPNLLIKSVVSGNVLYFSDYKWSEAVAGVMRSQDQD